MPAEIERKFLVNGNGWRQGQGIRICQGYLNPDKERTVRVRLAGEKAFLTVKGMNIGATRAEYEYPIPVSHAEELLKICDGPVLEKNRYAVDHNGLIWEVDEFLGENEGLIVAEVELKAETSLLTVRMGRTGSHRRSVLQFHLCAHPFSKWQ